MNVDTFMQQAREYAASGEGLDVVYKVLSTLALTHPMHTVRAAELQDAGVASGEYDRILRGEYARRGPETTERPLKDDLLHSDARELATQVADAAPPLAAERDAFATPRNRETAAGGRRRRSRARALLGAPPGESGRGSLLRTPGNPGTAEVATNVAIPADDLDRLADASDMHGIDLTVVGPKGLPAPGRPAARCSDPMPRAADRGRQGVRQGDRAGRGRPHCREPDLP